MDTSPCRYDPPLPSYAKISCKNGAQVLQNLCSLNFDEFEFGKLKNPHDHPWVKLKNSDLLLIYILQVKIIKFWKK